MAQEKKPKDHHEFILWGPWMFAHNVRTYHIIVFEIFQSGIKWWTDRLTLRSLVLCCQYDWKGKKIRVGSSHCDAHTTYSDTTVAVVSSLQSVSDVAIHCKLMQRRRAFIQNETLQNYLLLSSHAKIPPWTPNTHTYNLHPKHAYVSKTHTYIAYIYRHNVR